MHGFKRQDVPQAADTKPDLPVQRAKRAGASMHRDVAVFAGPIRQRIAVCGSSRLYQRRNTFAFPSVETPFRSRGAIQLPTMIFG